MSDHTLIRACFALIAAQFVMTSGVFLVLRKIRDDAKAIRTSNSMLLAFSMDRADAEDARRKKKYRESRA